MESEARRVSQSDWGWGAKSVSTAAVTADGGFLCDRAAVAVQGQDERDIMYITVRVKSQTSAEIRITDI